VTDAERIKELEFQLQTSRQRAKHMKSLYEASQKRLKTYESALTEIHMAGSAGPGQGYGDKAERLAESALRKAR